MDYYIKAGIFLLINFGALGLGGLLQGEGPQSDWYQQLNKAPWTPPGWVFGATWFTIMACFSFYMAQLITKDMSAIVISLFMIQFILNVVWNPVFFRYHQPLPALFIITGLFLVVTSMFLVFYPKVGWKSVLLLPYVIWLALAITLNWYAVVEN